MEMGGAGATLPPWLSPWSSGLVYGQRVWQGAAPERYRPRPRLTIYTLAHPDHAPVLRFGSWAEEGSGAGDGSAGEGSAPPPPPGVRWERVPLDRAPWHVDVPVPVQPRLRERAPPFHTFSIAQHGVEFGGEGSEAAWAAWGGVLRGWACGATLLALLVLLVRVGERLLDWKILLRRRRLHREWQRANVRATARLDGAPSLADIGADCTVEMPPPYSACGGAPGGGGSATAPKDEHEEPPPPYTDVVTQFFDKNGQPVLLYSRDPPPPPPAPAAPVAPAPSDQDEAIARILRAYGVDGVLTELPPPVEDMRLFQHVYQALSSRAEAESAEGNERADDTDQGNGDGGDDADGADVIPNPAATDPDGSVVV